MLASSTVGEGAMLTRLRFQNYRAFAKGEFAIKPITVLVGANSVGKTSILQLPLVLKQTALVSGKNYRSALKIHGREVNIGNPKNLFFNQNISSPIEIVCEFTSDRMLHEFSERYFSEFSDIIVGTIEYYHYALSVANKTKKDDKFFERVRRVNLKTLYTEDEFQLIKNFLVTAGELVSSLPDEKLPPPYAFRHISPRYRRSGTRGSETVKTVSVADIERYYLFLRGITKISTADFWYSLKIAFDDKQPEVKQLKTIEMAVGQKKDDILRISFDDSAIRSISSSLVDNKVVDAYQKTLDRSVNPTHSIFSIFSSTTPLDPRFHFPELIRNIFCSVQEEVGSFFDDNNLGHIGPLRAHPKRFYFLDTAEAGTSEGNLLVESLRENQTLREKVNGWLAAFSINISVAQLEEIIFRLSVRNQDHTFDLDITDVGFGISQVLPILVEGFASPLGKVILIEQPEIHLHPKMQGELADLFIDIAHVNPENELDQRRRYLVIETHSEYFLSRLRRRISEGKLSHSDVAIYFVEKDPHRSGSRVRGVHMPVSGEFEWPEEFYEDDLEDTVAVLLNSAKNQDT